MSKDDQQRATPERSAYAGPERRRMTSRAWSDWSHRDEHFENRVALESARDIAILEKLRGKARDRGRTEEAAAIWSGIWELQLKLAEWRKRIAENCAPWFTDEAFR